MACSSCPSCLKPKASPCPNSAFHSSLPPPLNPEPSPAADDDYGIPIPGAILPPDHWARTAIKRLPPPGPLDWTVIFGHEAPLVLDLGCGNGRFVIASALSRPDFNHVGIEILPVVIRYATRRANQRGLSNVRLAVIGAYEFLAQFVAPASAAEIHLYHPQPYRDGDRKHRRLLTPQFLALVHRSLAAGGLAVFQTDNRAYWQYLQKVLPLFFEFEELNSPWADAPAGRTRREIYARRHAMRIYRGQGRPRPELSLELVQELARTAPRPNFDA